MLRWPRGCVPSLVSMMAALRVSDLPAEGHSTDTDHQAARDHVFMSSVLMQGL